MTISLYSSNTSHVRINLLEIALSILNNFKFGETYSIDMEIDFDSHFITDGGDIRDRFFISQRGYIIDHPYEYEMNHEEDSAGVFSEEEIKIKAKPYSDKEFIKIVCGRIERGLEHIGGVNISLTTAGNKIITTFQLDFITKSDYKDFLIITIRQRISELNPTYTVDEIETGVWNQIQQLSNILKSKTLKISPKDFGTLLSYNNTGKTVGNGDSIDVFSSIFPNNILSLILFVFLYQEKIGGKIIQNGRVSKVELLQQFNSFTETIKPQGIGFNKDNGQVTYFGKDITTLEGVNKQFFGILFEKCRNVRVKPEDICKAMGKGTVGGYNDYAGYLRGRLSKLPKTIKHWINNGPDGYILNDK